MPSTSSIITTQLPLTWLWKHPVPGPGKTAAPILRARAKSCRTGTCSSYRPGLCRSPALLSPSASAALTAKVGKVGGGIRQCLRHHVSRTPLQRPTKHRQWRRHFATQPYGQAARVVPFRFCSAFKSFALVPVAFAEPCRLGLHHRLQNRRQSSVLHRPERTVTEEDGSAKQCWIKALQILQRGHLVWLPELHLAQQGVARVDVSGALQSSASGQAKMGGRVSSAPPLKAPVVFWSS